MFFQIKNERFKMASVTRYRASEEAHPVNGKWYLTIRFGAIEKQFAFDTQAELTGIVKYLDTVFKVQIL